MNVVGVAYAGLILRLGRPRNKRRANQDDCRGDDEARQQLTLKRFRRLASIKTLTAAGALSRFDLGRPESAFRLTRFHGAERGHNSISGAQDAFCSTAARRRIS